MNIYLHHTHKCFLCYFIFLLVFTPYSRIFHLYVGSQQYNGRKPGCVRAKLTAGEQVSMIWTHQLACACTAALRDLRWLSPNVNSSIFHLYARKRMLG